MSTASQVENILQSAYGLKKSGSELRFNSPLRVGADGMTCTIEFIDDEHGKWYDHKEGVGGSLYDLAEKLGIETPKREKVDNSKRGYDSLAEYAALKGVPEQIFIDAKWEQITYFDKRPCFVFPTLGGLRYRFIDGQKPSFKSVEGFKPCWYGLDRAIKIAKESNQKLIICNGEPSTIVAQYHGIAAFCMPGGENHKITPELLTELKSKWGGEIVIALDCDDTGRKGIKRFADAFTPAGIKHVMLDLMLSSGGDLADFCKLHGESTLTDLGNLPKIGQARIDVPEKPADVQDLAKLAKELRDIRKAENEIDRAKLPAVLDQMQAEIDQLRLQSSPDKVVSVGSVAAEYKQWVEDSINHPSAIRGLKSGIKRLDELLWGFEGGRHFVILAETGMGKSTLIASIGSKWIDQAPGLIFGTETMPRNLMNKFAAFRTGISTDRIAGGQMTPNEAGLLFTTIGLFDNQMQVHFETSQNPTVGNILAVARRGIREFGYKWAIIDSLSNVKADAIHASIFDTVSAASDCAQELARMGLAVLCTAQVGRNLNDRGFRMPTLHDGKGSGRIEENADVVIGLYNHSNLVKQGEAKPDDKFPPGTIALRTLKDREHGESEGKTIQLKFKGGTGVYND